ncbi:MAG: glycosyltransferase family 4 protein [Anaerolineae bacterium]|nr:glycosyltransferase family 4 protein [Anaerolineae bacterium]
MDRSALIVGAFNSLGNHHPYEDLAKLLSESGWTVITTSHYRPRLLRALDMIIISYLKHKHYQIAYINVYSGRAFLWAESVCRILRYFEKPYILTLHDGAMPAFSRKYPARVRSLLESAKVVTTPSRYLQEHMAEYRHELQLLPNAINCSMYEFMLRVRPTPRLIWLRAFNSVYNPSLAADVIALLKDDFPDIRLTMIGADKGDGSFQSFQSRVSAKGLNSHIACIGWIPSVDVPQRLREHDIFLNTTNVDNTPVSLIEAMACGLCIVSTNVGGIPYLVEHEQDALLVPPDDPEAMATAVSRILTEKGLAERLSRNARTKALNFDWSVIFPQWEAILSHFLATK